MSELDVLAIGNAIVDISAPVDEAFLTTHNIIKGSMALIDDVRADFLWKLMDNTKETSGGSAANTAAGVVNFGGRAAFMGKVADDSLGHSFAKDLIKQGVFFDTPFLLNQTPTARCIIFNTPDGERTMNTYLGACLKFSAKDLDQSLIARAKITYFEGYLWDPPLAKEAILQAAKLAHENGREVAFSLSDSFCVDRHRSEFLTLIRENIVDMIFANEAELLALYQTLPFDEAICQLAKDVPKLACVTRGEQGSVIVTKNQILTIPALAVDKVVDTTGAGDLYAAGFLYGYCRNFTHQQSAQLASLAGSQVVQQIGPRLMSDLRVNAKAVGLLPA